MRLEQPELDHWAKHGYLVLRGALNAAETRALQGFADELAAWPEWPGAWMKYFETGPERRLCRVERFLEYHAGLRALLARPDLAGALAALFGEPARLFKEKVNYKLPGGAGFAPHQDAPAFASFGARDHLTLMLSIDATTPENGCLELVHGAAEPRVLPQEADGTLARSLIRELDFTPLPTAAGDAVIFNAHVPHRSGPNASGKARRVLYVTYNPASQGDWRDAYYERKRREFPPECERGPDYAPPKGASPFNLGNPIR